MKQHKSVIVCITVMISFLLSTYSLASYAKSPITIATQGSFSVGGTVTTEAGEFNPKNPFEEAGQTLHGDHLFASYQIPVKPRKLPIVMWHGYGQFSKTWGETPDGREGFKTLFLRKDYSVYVIDQPRRGGAAKGTVGKTIAPKADEQFWFGQFRVGVWPNYFQGVQFSQSPEVLNQYFRQMVPDTGPFDVDLMSNAVSALFNKIGNGILFTHSHSGGLGWSAVMKNPNIKAVVAFEPGSNFVFPEGEVPAPMPSSFDTLEGVAVPLKDFMALTRIPIVIYYGDNIPTAPTDIPTLDAWRIRLAMAKLWRDTVNSHGGDVTLVHLPDIGITGNTHFPFSDLNNEKIADLVQTYLTNKNLN